MTAQTIIACPFCGVKGRLYKDPVYGLYQAVCSNEKCLVRPETRKFFTPELAIKAWNERSILTA